MNHSLFSPPGALLGSLPGLQAAGIALNLSVICILLWCSWYLWCSAALRPRHSRKRTRAPPLPIPHPAERERWHDTDSNDGSSLSPSSSSYNSSESSIDGFCARYFEVVLGGVFVGTYRRGRASGASYVFPTGADDSVVVPPHQVLQAIAALSGVECIAAINAYWKMRPRGELVVRFWRARGSDALEFRLTAPLDAADLAGSHALQCAEDYGV